LILNYICFFTFIDNSHRINQINNDYFDFKIRDISQDVLVNQIYFFKLKPGDSKCFANVVIQCLLACGESLFEKVYFNVKKKMKNDFCL